MIIARYDSVPLYHFFLSSFFFFAVPSTSCTTAQSAFLAIHVRPFASCCPFGLYSTIVSRYLMLCSEFQIHHYTDFAVDEKLYYDIAQYSRGVHKSREFWGQIGRDLGLGGLTA